MMVMEPKKKKKKKMEKMEHHKPMVILMLMMMMPCRKNESLGPSRWPSLPQLASVSNCL